MKWVLCPSPTISHQKGNICHRPLPRPRVPSTCHQSSHPFLWKVGCSPGPSQITLMGRPMSPAPQALSSTDPASGHPSIEQKQMQSVRFVSKVSTWRWGWRGGAQGQMSHRELKLLSSEDLFIRLFTKENQSEPGAKHRVTGVPILLGGCPQSSLRPLPATGHLTPLPTSGEAQPVALCPSPRPLCPGRRERTGRQIPQLCPSCPAGLLGRGSPCPVPFHVTEVLQAHVAFKTNPLSFFFWHHCGGRTQGLCLLC